MKIVLKIVIFLIFVMPYVDNIQYAQSLKPYKPLSVKVSYDDPHGDWYNNGKKIEFFLEQKMILSIEFLKYETELPGPSSRISYLITTGDKLQMETSHVFPPVNPSHDKPTSDMGDIYLSISREVQYNPRYLLVGRFWCSSYELWLSVPKDYQEGCTLKRKGDKEYTMVFTFLSRNIPFKLRSPEDPIMTKSCFSDFALFVMNNSDYKGSYFRGYLPFCSAFPQKDE